MVRNLPSTALPLGSLANPKVEIGVPNRYSVCLDLVSEEDLDEEEVKTDADTEA